MGWSDNLPQAPFLVDSAVVFEGKIFLLVHELGANNCYSQFFIQYDKPSGTYGPPLAVRDIVTIGSSTIAYDGKLYVFGGANKVAGQHPPYPIIATVDIYDPTLDSWFSTNKMPVPSFYHTSIKMGEDIFIIAGESHLTHKYILTIRVFHPPTETWSIGHQLPFSPYIIPIIIKCKGRIHIINSDNGEHYVLRKSGVWKKKKAIPLYGLVTLCEAMGKKIYVAGIQEVTSSVTQGTQWLKTLAYDPNTDNWTEDLDMPTWVAVGKSCKSDGAIYYFTNAYPGLIFSKSP